MTSPTQPTPTAAELRAVQTPLKQRYRLEPAAATVVLRRTATFADPGVTATVDTWTGPVRAGLHPATGGDGTDACSGDMLLEALLACTGVTLRAVATALGVPVAAATLTATASFDARGTLGIDPEVPVGLGPVALDAVLDTDADDAALARLARSTERYCVVARSLREPVTLTVRRADPNR